MKTHPPSESLPQPGTPTAEAASAADAARCPSSECRPGALLLGIVLPDGRVAFAHDKIVIDEEFIRTARQGRPPEKRFRFSTACAQGACRQWDGGGCSLIDRLVDHFGQHPELLEESESDEGFELPYCSIRDECRWYRQHGDRACRICPEVVTDAANSDAELPARVQAARRVS